MARKLLVSCLGTNNYTPVRYAAPAGSGEAHAPEPLRYIQEARVRGLRTRQPPVHIDEVATLCTAKARGLNWETASGQAELDGLRDRLRALGFDPKPVSIEDGASEQELWGLFHALQDIVETGDELYIDVTHGFRAQPILLVTALDYVCRAKGAVVAEISYGAFDAALPDDPELKQTFDLSPFLVLRDWGAAWARFEESRDLRGLAAVFAENEGRLRRRLRGPSPLQRLTGPLKRLATALRSNDLRAAPALAQDSLEALRAVASEVEAQPEVKPLSVVLRQLEDALERLVPTDESDVARLRAQVEVADWSRAGGLFPQALTVIRETVTDVVAVRMGLDPFDGALRVDVDGAAGALSVWAADGKRGEHKVPAAVADRWATLIADPEWARAVAGVAGRAQDARNLVNHGWTSGTGDEIKDKASWLERQTDACIDGLREILAEIDATGP